MRQALTVADSTGDGVHELWGPGEIGVDVYGNLFVLGSGSDNAFKVSQSGQITQIIDASGDGLGNILDQPYGLCVSDRDVFVSGLRSDNVFRISLAGTAPSASPWALIGLALVLALAGTAILLRPARGRLTA